MCTDAETITVTVDLCIPPVIPSFQSAFQYGDSSDFANMSVYTGTGSSVTAGSVFHKNPGANSDVTLMELDSVGNVVWQKQYGGSKDDLGQP